MTAFPVAKLPLHPPENTNTLWASLGNMRGGVGGRDTQTDGEEGKKSDVRKRNKEMTVESDKMRHMHMYGMIKSEIMRSWVFFFKFLFHFWCSPMALALLAEQQSFLTLHICASNVWPNSLHFLKTKKMEFSSVAVCGNVPICEVCFTAEIFQSDKSHSLFRKKVEQ